MPDEYELQETGSKSTESSSNGKESKLAEIPAEPETIRTSDSDRETMYTEATASSTAMLVRRSVVLQFEKLMDFAKSRTEAAHVEAPSVPEKEKRSWSKWAAGDAPNAPLHADINTLFAGVKHPPLSKEELQAFYYYSLASEPMSVVVFTALATVVLQNLAAGAGVQADDHSVRCNYTVKNYACVTNIAGSWVDPSSFSLYTIAASVLCQAVVFITLGALADHGSIRKKFMMTLMVLACLTCFSMVFIRNSEWFLAASIIIILSQVAFGASYCFYNSYIPVLSAVHWDVLSAPESKRGHVFEATMNTLSAVSSAYGYIGAVACFAIVGGFIFGLQTINESSGFGDSGFFDNLGVQTYSMQIGIFIAGLWTLTGLYWPLKYIRDRPYDPLPKGTSYWTYSWKQLYGTAKKARKLPNTFLMLLAWFLLSDAITTVGSTTILFATNSLGFTSTQILILAIAAPLTAGSGSYFWLWIQRKFNYSTKRMLLMIVAMSIVLPVYGSIGFIKPLGFGLQQKWELFPAGIYYGFLLGGIQSFSRVLFSDLIPRGHEGEFFALYSITDKGSSWFGPLIVGAITDVSHEIRYGFVFLLFMLILPVVFLAFLNVEKGQRDAEAFRIEESNHGLPCHLIDETGEILHPHSA